jgi:hypothetical protein
MKATTVIAEGFDFATTQAIFARSEIELTGEGAEMIFEPFEIAAAASSSSVTATSSPTPVAKGKWRDRFKPKKQVIQLAPMLTVVVIGMHRPAKTSGLRVVSSAPSAQHLAHINAGEYIEPTVRYPVLMRAIERGRLSAATRPDPRQRTLRDTAEPESLSELQQVAFGKLGDPPAEHSRRPSRR